MGFHRKFINNIWSISGEIDQTELNKISTFLSFKERDRIPHWVPGLLTLELHRNVESEHVLGPKMHSPKSLWDAAVECYKHAQICKTFWKLICDACTTTSIPIDMLCHSFKAEEFPLARWKEKRLDNTVMSVMSVYVI